MSNETLAQQELPAILTVEQMGRFLRISRGMAYQLVHRRDFPSVHIGRAIRVPREALLKWLEAQAGADQKSFDQISPVKRSRLSVRK